jgi:perosamine synthetase
MTGERKVARRHLAINGGRPVRATPFPPRGVITHADKAAVDRLFDHAIAAGQAIGYGGPEEDLYCNEFAQTLGGGYADGVSSGTAAIYVALRALELEPFSEIVVGAINDPGGIMPIPLANCIPIIADAAPGCYNTGPEQVNACLTELTRGIIVPHIAGEPADVAAIGALAEQHGIPLIEDCAQAHGACLHGRALGSFGKAAGFSTMHGKHYNTGGQGGMVFTRDLDMYERVRRHADRGKPFGRADSTTNSVASLNLNMDELRAVIGRAQLSRLGDGVAARRRVAADLVAGLSDNALGAVSAPSQLPGAEPSFWFLRLRFHPERVQCTKGDFCAALAAEGIPLLEEPLVPHLFAWFRERRVFGSSGYPWAAPAYAGDREREFPCPNAAAALADHFNLSINERWGDREVEDTLAAFHKVAFSLGPMSG